MPTKAYGISAYAAVVLPLEKIPPSSYLAFGWVSRKTNNFLWHCFDVLTLFNMVILHMLPNLIKPHTCKNAFNDRFCRIFFPRKKMLEHFFMTLYLEQVTRSSCGMLTPINFLLSTIITLGSGSFEYSLSSSLSVFWRQSHNSWSLNKSTNFGGKVCIRIAVGPVTVTNDHFVEVTLKPFASWS